MRHRMRHRIRHRIRHPITVLAAGLVALSMLSCAGLDPASVEISQGLVIRDVTVVNTRDGTLRSGMAVVMDGGSIRQISPNREVRLTGTAQAVDGAGKYLVPGYLDMHTHALSAADQQPAYWPLLVANGVTGIREMAGSAALIQRARQLNAERAAGRLLAPEVLQVPGDLIGGAPSAAVAARMVQKHKADGADFVKVVGGSREVVLAVLAEATRQGLGVAGHLPLAISSGDAAQAGWRAIEHLGSGIGMLLECADDEARIRRALLNGEGAKPVLSPEAIVSPMLSRSLDAPFYQQALDSHSPTRCQGLAAATAQSGTWQVPTLIRLRTMHHSADAAYRNDPNLAYVDKTRRALWDKLGQQFAATVPASAATTFSQYYAAQLRFVGRLQNSGAKLLAGSDLGGIWIIPGFGLHQEFAELASAGLSPLQVLQATTLNGAMFLGRQATMGTVGVGKVADLVLLDANPLLAVASLGKIAGVVLNGRYLGAAELDRMKREVADAYSRQPLKNLASAFDATHVH